MPAIAAVGQVAVTNSVIGVNYTGGNYVPIYGNSDLLGSNNVPVSTTRTITINNPTGIYQSLLLQFAAPANVSRLTIYNNANAIAILDTTSVGTTPVIVPIGPDGGTGYNVTITTNSGGSCFSWVYGSRLPLSVSISNVGQTPLLVQEGAQYGTGSGTYISTRATTVGILQQTLPTTAGTTTYNVAIDAGISGIKLSFNAIKNVTAVDVFGVQTGRFYKRFTVTTRAPIFIPLPAAYDNQISFRVTVTANTGVTMWVEEVFGFEIPAIAKNVPGNASYIYNAGMTNSATMFAGIAPPVGLEGWDIAASILCPPNTTAANEAVEVSMVGDTSGYQLVLAVFVFACPTIAAGAQGITLSDSKTVHFGQDALDTDALFVLDTTVHLLVQYGSFQPAIGITTYPL